MFWGEKSPKDGEQFFVYEQSHYNGESLKIIYMDWSSLNVLPQNERLTVITYDWYIFIVGILYENNSIIIGN